MDPRIADFIAKNQGRYTREALRQQLIDAGYEPDAIDATWAALDTPDPDEASVAGEGFWPRFFLFLIGLNVAVFLIVAFTTGMFEVLTSGGGGLLGVFAVVLGIGALISWGIVAAVGPAKLGRTTAIVIGGLIPIVFALLIGGSCYALASTFRPPPPAFSGEMEVHIDPPLSFDGSGLASCQPQRDGRSYSIRAERLGTIDGREVSTSVDTYEANINEMTTSVYVTLAPNSDEDPFLEWTAGPSTDVQVDAAADGMSGTATFEELVALQQDPALGPTDPISGTITWNCEETAP